MADDSTTLWPRNRRAIQTGRMHALTAQKVRAFSSPPSPSPIAPFAQQRSSFVRQPRVSVSHEWERPSIVRL